MRHFNRPGSFDEALQGEGFKENLSNTQAAIPLKTILVSAGRVAQTNNATKEFCDQSNMNSRI